MGNCMEAFRNDTLETEKEEELELETETKKEEESELETETKKEEESELETETKKNNNNVRIKIVLTKEELEWLMVELQKTQGKKIEQVLEEIQMGRERNVSWKPALDSIVESPEVPET